MLTGFRISGKDAGAVKWWRIAVVQQSPSPAQPPPQPWNILLCVGPWAAHHSDDLTLTSVSIWQKDIPLLFLLLFSPFHIFVKMCYSP